MPELICPVENPGDGIHIPAMQGVENPVSLAAMRLKIAPILTQNLLALADAYFAAVKPKNKTVSMQSISRTFHGDPPFFDNLRAGKSTCGLTKYDEIIDRFEDRWPEGKMHLFPKLIDPRHGPRRKKPKPKRRRANAQGTKEIREAAPQAAR